MRSTEKILYSVVFLLISTFSLGCSQQENNSNYKLIEPNNYPGFAEYRKNALKLPAEAGKYYDFIKYGSIRQEANWTQDKRGSWDVEAPPGWQACKPLYDLTSTAGDWGLYVAPSGFETTPQPKPTKFHVYVFTLRARGSHNPFDQTGSWIQLNNVGMRVIPDTADNAERLAMGCEMP